VASVTLRFYGRYFYAEEMDAAGRVVKISAIAPNFDEDKFGKHQPFMSIQRDQIVTPDEGDTTLAPTYRLATDVPAISNAELFVYDLTERRVVYDLNGDVSLDVDDRVGHPTRRLLDLTELENIRKANEPPELDDDALEVDSDGLSNAIIEVTKGDGKAKPVVEGGKIRLAKAKEAEAIKGPEDARLAKDDKGKFVEFEPADLVEFDIKLPAGKDALTLSFIDSDKKGVGKVTVRQGTCVAFSNLCSGVRPAALPDLEFSEYYKLLDDSPGGDALVPFELPPAAGLIEGSDCDMQVRLKYTKS
jgi:hypothetical protein